MRLLLQVEQLQYHVVSVLLDKLMVVCLDDKYDAGSAQQIVAQLRWLDSLQEGEKVAEKLFEVLDAVPLELQKDIILAIPGIIQDPQHHKVAQQLRQRMAEQKKLLVPCIDALSNLTLTPELWTELRETVICSLNSADPLDLPILVNFLFQSVHSSDEALQVISAIRQKSGIGEADDSLREEFNTGGTIDNKRSVESMVLDTIKTFICQKKVVAEAWLKCFTGLRCSGEHKPLDMTVIVVLHACGQQKPVTTMLRSKLRAGYLTRALLDKTFHLQKQILKNYFSSLLSLAQALLHSPEPEISSFGQAIYECSFVSLDIYSQQEIMGCLITHIGSGAVLEVDAALSVLVTLVETRLTEVNKFTLLIKNIMDYVENLSPSQLRMVYSMMTTLAFQGSSEDGSIQDDLIILIRKQLTNNSMKYKRLGVIGGITVVQKLACYSSADSQKQVMMLLQLIRSSCNYSIQMGALCVDELANVIQTGILNKNIENWISENVISDFQEDFIADIDEDSRPPRCALPVDLQFRLDQEKESCIALNLTQLVMNDLKYIENRNAPTINDGKRRIGGVSIPPNLRLVLLCEKNQSNGQLEGVDALLGCPIYFPKEELLDSLKTLDTRQKTLLCNTLFTTANWFIELINGFSDQREAEMKGKVIARLHNVTSTIDMLKTCLAFTPNYTPPTAVFDTDEPGKPVTAPLVPKVKKKAKKPASKKQKVADKNTSVNDNTTVDQTVDNIDTQESPVKDDPLPSTNATATVDFAKCARYFRELDMDVFLVLHNQFITRTSLDSNLNTRGAQTVQLEPAQMLFLLENLVRKLEHALASPTTLARRMQFTATKDEDGFAHLDLLTPAVVSEKVVKLLPALCQHLITHALFFQDIVKNNDGILDGAAMFTPEAKQHATCLYLLLQTLYLLFSWFANNRQSKSTLLQEALQIVAASFTEDSESHTTEQQDVKSIIKRLTGFRSSLPDLTCAVVLCRLIACLSELDAGQHSGSIVATSEDFLKRRWFKAAGEAESGSKANSQIKDLLSLLLQHCDAILDTLDTITTDGFAELMQGDQEYSETYPTLTKSSCFTFFKVIWIKLLDAVKQVGTCKNNDLDIVRWEKLEGWSKAVALFYSLVNLIKVFTTRSHLKSAMTYGRQFMELFLRLAMPMVDSAFRAHSDDLVGLLKKLQQGTRGLHHLCSHSKIEKDIVLTREVPKVKKCLEMFVYRVKACLTVNHCLEAFWLGNLKNRDLKVRTMMHLF